MVINGAATSAFDSDAVWTDTGVNGIDICMPVASGWGAIGENSKHCFGTPRAGWAGIMLAESHPSLAEGIASNVERRRCGVEMAGSSQGLCRGISLGNSPKATFSSARPAQRPWLAATRLTNGSRPPPLALQGKLLAPDTNGNKFLAELFLVGAPGGGMHVATGMPAAAHLLLRVALAGRCSLDDVRMAFGDEKQSPTDVSKAASDGNSVVLDFTGHSLSEPKDAESFFPTINACETPFDPGIGESLLSEPRGLECLRPTLPKLDEPSTSGLKDLEAFRQFGSLPTLASATPAIFIRTWASATTTVCPEPLTPVFLVIQSSSMPEHALTAKDNRATEEEPHFSPASGNLSPRCGS